jgi:hypothetical protein
LALGQYAAQTGKCAANNYGAMNDYAYLLLLAGENDWLPQLLLPLLKLRSLDSIRNDSRFIAQKAMIEADMVAQLESCQPRKLY